MARVKRPAIGPPANRRRTRQRAAAEATTSEEPVGREEAIIGPPTIRNPSPPPRRPAPRRPTPPPRVPSPPPRSPSPPARNPSPPPPLPFRPYQQPDLNLTPQPSPIFEEDKVTPSTQPDDPLTAMVVFDPAVLKKSKTPSNNPSTSTPVDKTHTETEPMVVNQEQEVLLDSFDRLFFSDSTNSFSSEEEGDDAYWPPMSPVTYILPWRNVNIPEIVHMQVQTNAGDQSMEEVALEELAEDLGVDVADLLSDNQEGERETTNVEAEQPEQNVSNAEPEVAGEPEQTETPSVPVTATKKRKALGRIHASKSDPKPKKAATAKKKAVEKSPEKKKVAKISVRPTSGKKMAVRKEPVKRAIVKKSVKPVPEKKRTRSQSSSAAALQEETPTIPTPEASSSRTPQAKPTLPWGGFSSEGAQKRFQKLQTRKFLPDKGFDEQSIERHDFIREVIEAYGWQEFCKRRTAVNTTMVREFYAELFYAQSHIIQVRGTQIDISADAINQMLGLTAPIYSQYEQLLYTATKESLDEIIKDIGKSGCVWEPHRDYLLRVFKANQLTPQANVWVNFLKHSLSPTSHDSTLNIDRVVLLYAIMTGSSLNVGELIHQSMMYCAKKSQGQLYFPGLLHRLCIRARIPEYADDVVDNEKGDSWVIDLKTVERLKERGEVRKESELMKVMEDLRVQNNSLMDCLLAQGGEAVEKLEIVKREIGDKLELVKRAVEEKMEEVAGGMKEMMSGEKKEMFERMKVMEERMNERIGQMKSQMEREGKLKRRLKAQMKRMKLESKKMEAKNARLRRKIGRFKAAASAAASTSNT